MSLVLVNRILFFFVFVIKIEPYIALNPDAYGVGYQTKYKRAREAQRQDGERFQEEVLQMTYQERYIVNIAERSQACYFLEDLEEGYILSIHYTVLSEKNGEQLDISMNMKDSKNKMIVFQVYQWGMFQSLKGIHF